jgi:glycine cleavage system aminomethyltransferase T
MGPIPLLEESGTEIAFPIVRDMDAYMYERQKGADMEIGSYAHRPILVSPDDIPSIAESELSPTELPFTPADFERQLRHARELMPELLGAEGLETRHAINGLLSLTADRMPVVGETPEVKGLWSVAAVWIKEAPGIARAVAEWVTDGASEIDLHSADIARFAPQHRSARHVAARAAESYNKTYGIVHPLEQWDSGRGLRLSPFHARQEALGAVFYETAGWERPWWYESNAPLVEEYGDRVMPREAEWESRWWSAIINAEHLAMRDRVAMVDLSAFAIFDVVGPGSLDYLQRVALAECDVPSGRVIYTPILNAHGGFKSDLTIMRLAEDRFRIVTGGADGPRDFYWFHAQLPEDGSASLIDATSAWCTLGVWGPRARDLLSSVTTADVSNEGFPFARCRELEIGGLPVLASRISYVGDLGWELYAPMESGRALWDVLWEAGRPLGLVPAGIGVYGTTGRLEKGYRLFGAELDSEYDVVEAGLQRPTVKQSDFVGKEAYVRARETEPAALLCTLTVDDHGSSSGMKRYMLGREPILTPDGKPIVDRKGRGSYVTSAGSGPSVGKHILLAYLPPDHALEGGKLLVQYMGERYPVTVEVVGARPLFDPENTRIRG